MYEYIRNTYLEGVAFLIFWLFSKSSWVIKSCFYSNQKYILQLLWKLLWCNSYDENISETNSENEYTDLPELIPLPVKTHEQLYEEKNKIAFDKLENIPKEQLPLESFKHKILMEYLPSSNGNVIMYYNHKQDSFYYYSDRVLSYNIVNLIGRKYAVRFNCKSLFLESDAPIQPEPEEKKETKDEKETNSTNTSTLSHITKPNVFAKMKSYNNMKVKLSDNNISTPNTTNSKIEKQIIANVNRYTYDGKLTNFSFIQSFPKYKKMSYKDFKKMKNITPSV